MLHLRRDLRQRLQHKAALVHRRVGRDYIKGRFAFYVGVLLVE